MPKESLTDSMRGSHRSLGQAPSENTFRRTLPQEKRGVKRSETPRRLRFYLVSLPCDDVAKSNTGMLVKWSSAEENAFPQPGRVVVLRY